MSDIVLSGSGLYVPRESISNRELVDSFNRYVSNYNAQNQAAILAGECEALSESSAEFIEKASGIRSRYVIEKTGILDPSLMHPIIEERSDAECSLQAEIAVNAAKSAMASAGKNAGDIDTIILACSNMQRSYPAMAIEVQAMLGINGFAFDMNVACSSATFAITTARSMIASKQSRCVLVVNPEICSAQLNFRDRDSHFIFGDVATAVIVESSESATADLCFKIVDCQLLTDYSSNIRNNAGFMNRLTPGASDTADKLFYQQGRRVFKDVTQAVVGLVEEQLSRQDLNASQLKRLWLHQANINMNRVIADKLMGHHVDESLSPVTLDEFANTASAGSIVAFHRYKQGLAPGDIGLLCSFGAGYSIGSLLLQCDFSQRS